MEDVCFCLHLNVFEQTEGAVATGGYRRGHTGQQMGRGSLKLSPPGQVGANLPPPQSIFYTHAPTRDSG